MTAARPARRTVLQRAAGLTILIGLGAGCSAPTGEVVDQPPPTQTSPPPLSAPQSLPNSSNDPFTIVEFISATPSTANPGDRVLLSYDPLGRGRSCCVSVFDIDDPERLLYVITLAPPGSDGPGRLDDRRLPGLPPLTHPDVLFIDPAGNQIHLPDDIRPGTYALCNSIFGSRENCFVLAVTD
ncbi:MAG: hypothetical protein GXP35_08370 [Actinobacteria bacterium]|nr:hypothetical protein [Actinomycetota bacterium]